MIESYKQYEWPVRRFLVSHDEGKTSTVVEAQELVIHGTSADFYRYVQVERDPSRTPVTPEMCRQVLVASFRYFVSVRELPDGEATEESSEPGEPELKARAINYVLPGKFWEFLELGKKIHAMRELRMATGMSIKSAQQVVEAITSTKVADLYKVMPLADLPMGTIIKGTGDGKARNKWVFEKMTAYNWYSPGDETPYSSENLGSFIGRYEVLYVPGGES